MKYILNIAILFSIFTLNYCAGNDPVEDTVICTAPITDGKIYEFAASCRVSIEEEHIRLEGVTVASGQSISIWAKATDTSGNNGIKIVIDATNITYTNLDDTPGTNTFAASHGGLSGTTLCFDLHYAETPLHTLAWKGAECDSNKVGAGNEGTTIWNKEPTDAVTGSDIEANTKYLIQVTNATLSTVQTKEPIFSE